MRKLLYFVGNGRRVHEVCGGGGSGGDVAAGLGEAAEGLLV